MEAGLDCVGVAAMAMGIETARADYCLRFADMEAVHETMAGAGLRRIPAELAAAGDMLLTRPGPMRLHFAILTGDGYVHADLRLRRTVEAPGPVPGPVLSAWRHPAHEAAGCPSARERA